MLYGLCPQLLAVKLVTYAIHLTKYIPIYCTALDVLFLDESSGLFP
jgi:hypothetical protein